MWDGGERLTVLSYVTHNSSGACVRHPPLAGCVPGTANRKIHKTPSDAYIKFF